MFDFIKNAISSLFGGHKQELISPIPDDERKKRAQQPTPTATPKAKDEDITPDRVKRGIQKWQSNAPIASASADLATGAKRLQEKGLDPWLPVVMSIMETGGGAKVVGANNAFNLRGLQGGQNKFVDYPNYSIAINGGDNGGQPAKGFVGTLLEHPGYEAYRKSKNLEDFFRTYTPPGAEHGNPEMPELIDRYNKIRALVSAIDEANDKSARVNVYDERKKKKLNRLEELAY